MTRVLIVDDSALMRRLIGGVLTEAGFEIATARNGLEGLEQLTAWKPDVVTLDINMPEMDGLTALSMMMQARPTPVVMVSSLTEQGAQATFEALALGAVDFIAKPGGTISLTVDEIAGPLIEKVRAAARSRPRLRRTGESGAAAMHAAAVASVKARPAAQRVVPLRSEALRSEGARSVPSAIERSRSELSKPPLREARAAPAPAAERSSAPRPAVRVGGVVVVGVSTGGPRTLEDILPLLPAEFPWPILIAQHMPANFTDTFARRMDKLCALTVREVSDTLPLEPGHVYIGRGGTDLVVAERLGRLVAQSRPESPEHLWHPSVDILVESAMKHLPPGQIVAVQLTGMGNDGARAMARLKQSGGRTIAESKDTAVVFGMPLELIELGGASLVLPCGEVARQLCQWIRK